VYKIKASTSISLCFRLCPRRNLKKGGAKHPPPTTNFRCEGCGQCYTSKSNLQRHVSFLTKKLFFIDQCPTTWLNLRIFVIIRSYVPVRAYPCAGFWKIHTPPFPSGGGGGLVIPALTFLGKTMKNWSKKGGNNNKERSLPCYVKILTRLYVCCGSFQMLVL
jgi:hypothetical protein